MEQLFWQLAQSTVTKDVWRTDRFYRLFCMKTYSSSSQGMMDGKSHA